MKLVKLSGLYPELALAEIRALIPYSIKSIDGGYYFLTKSNENTQRLAYTQWISNVIIDGLVGTWDQRVRKLDWEKIILKPAFIVESHKFKITTSKSEQFVAYLKSKGFFLTRKKDYDILDFFQMPAKIVIGKREMINTGKFELRKPHTRPFHKPVSLQPRLARAMINLLGPKPGTIHDPCCGTGGLVIEAALLNLPVSGADVDKEMVEGTLQNLEELHKHVPITLEDVFLSKQRHDSIVTDLPYGLRGKAVTLDFFERFFFSLPAQCKKQAVIALPADINTQKLLPVNWAITHTFLVPLHKNLTKKIIVCKKTN